MNDYNEYKQKVFSLENFIKNRALNIISNDKENELNFFQKIIERYRIAESKRFLNDKAGKILRFIQYALILILCNLFVYALALIVGWTKYGFLNNLYIILIIVLLLNSAYLLCLLNRAKITKAVYKKISSLSEKPPRNG